MLVATVWFGMRPLRKGPPPSLLARSAEAANLAVLICALRLGEVFGATTASIALAAGLIGYLQAESVQVVGRGRRYSDAVSNAAGHGGSPSIAIPDYWWYVARADLLEAALRSHVEGAGLALDLGSADGPSAAWLREAAERTVSLDIDPRGLGTDGVCGSALALPFDDGVFDVVSAFDVIEHCEPEATALAEVRRVLRPGGRFVMSVPAYTWAWSDFDVANGHHRRYTRARAVGRGRARRVQRAAGHLRVRHGLPDVRRRAAGPQGVAAPLDGRGRHRRAPPAAQAAQQRAARPVARRPRRCCAGRDLPFGSSVFLAATRPTDAPRPAGPPVSRRAGRRETTRARTSADGAGQPGRQRRRGERVDLAATPVDSSRRSSTCPVPAPPTGMRAQRAVEDPPRLGHEVADRDRAPRREHLGHHRARPARRGRGRCCARPSAAASPAYR